MSDASTTSLQVTTPLGAGALTLTRLEGDEHVSAPFHLRLTMASDAPVDTGALLGQPACVTLVDGDGNQRPLHGRMTRLVQRGNTCEADLRPWFWLLTLSSDNRIFQAKSVPDIVKAVFDGAGFADYRDDLTQTYDALDYCVQFGESDFDFTSRLMEGAGICYFFEHTSSVHTLVLADDSASFKDCENAASIPFLPLDANRDFLTDLRIDDVSSESSLAVQAYLTADFNFVTPSTSLKSTLGDGTRRVYDYPGGYGTKDAGDAVAKRRIEAFEAVASRIEGASPVRWLRPGAAFTMTGHPDTSLNAKWSLLSVSHAAERGTYRNGFTAVPATVPFRPLRATPRPRIGGSQTAMVVGPSGKEVYTDQYGRVKVQFHWDQLGAGDENSSVWIRVAQNWSGVSWGAFALPRVGQEVVVTFLDGDPDRPLVTGCVYNGDNPVPYALPDNQTRTVLKSNTSEGGGGFNEVRFEDKKDSEELYLHAQKDMTVDVLNNQTINVTQDRVVTVSKGKETLTVSEGDRTVEVSKGKETCSVAGARSMTVTGDETRTNKAAFTQTVTKDFTLTVDGDITIKATGAIVLQSGKSLTVTAGTSAGIQSTQDMSLQAGTTLSIQASASGTVDGGGMLALKGGLVKLN